MGDCLVLPLLYGGGVGYESSLIWFWKSGLWTIGSQKILIFPALSFLKPALSTNFDENEKNSISPVV